MTADKRITEATNAREAHKFLFEFQWKSLTESVQLITKGVGFYILLLLAVIGAIYNSKLVGTELKFAVVAIVTITILFGPMIIFIAWGVVRGIDDLENSLRKICPTQFEAAGMEKYFLRGRLAARVATGSAILILIVIVVTVALIQFR